MKLKKLEELYNDIKSELSDYLESYRSNEDYSFFHDLDEGDAYNLERSLRRWRERTIKHLLNINKLLDQLEETLEANEIEKRLEIYQDDP